jgi:tetratricopeptide (TPR) repeat protein
MTPEDLKMLNDLQSNPDEQLKKLVSFYKEKRILLHDLLNQEAIRLNIIITVINLFAVMLHSGVDGITADISAAHQLFEYAGNKENAFAKVNAARNYLYGVGNIKQDLEKAINLLEEAAPKIRAGKECPSYVDYWLGEAYRLKRDYKKATEAFKKIKKEEKEDHSKALQHIKDMHLKSLVEMYGGTDKSKPLPNFTTLEEFLVAIKEYYANLVKRYNLLSQITMPADDSDSKITLRRYYDKLCDIYRCLIQVYSAKKCYYQKNIKLITNEVMKAIPELEISDLVLDLGIKSSSTPTGMQEEKKASESVTVASQSASILSSAVTPSFVFGQSWDMHIKEAKSYEEEPEWVKVSSILDGYDPGKAMHLAAAEVEVTRLRLDSLWSQEAIFNKHILEAKRDKTTTKLLEDKLTALQTERKAIEAQCETAKRKQDRLLQGAEIKELQRQVTTERRFFFSSQNWLFCYI